MEEREGSTLSDSTLSRFHAVTLRRPTPMTRNQEIRKEILLQLYGLRPVPLSPYAIARRAQRAQFDFTEREIKAECEFLVGQGLASTVEDPASGEVKYVITSRGVIEQENGAS